jgi:hypothetical protein
VRNAQNTPAGRNSLNTSTNADKNPIRKYYEQSKSISLLKIIYRFPAEYSGHLIDSKLNKPNQ